MTVTPIFPTLIHHFDVSSFQEIKSSLIDFCYQERKRNPIGVSISNRGGWQSDLFYYNADNILVSLIKEEIVAYFQDNNIWKSGTTMKFSTAWININKRRDFNRSHHHADSTLSGVFWIKTSEKCGKILFDSPNSFEQGTEMKCYNEEIKNSVNLFEDYSYIPTEGRMLIFPSHLLHLVEINESRQDRISSSFNLILEKP